MTRDTVVREPQAIQDRAGIDSSAAQDLVAEGSMFSSGINFPGMGLDASLSLHQAFQAAGHDPPAQKKETKELKKGEGAEQVMAVDDPMEEASKMLNKVILESTEAHSSFIKLQGLEFSGQICKALESHAKFMEGAFKGLQKMLIVDKCQDHRKYEKVLTIIKDLGFALLLKSVF